MEGVIWTVHDPHKACNYWGSENTSTCSAVSYFPDDKMDCVPQDRASGFLPLLLLKYLSNFKTALENLRKKEKKKNTLHEHIASCSEL